jgi:uncharacterized protein YbaR (Trm112 family)
MPHATKPSKPNALHLYKCPLCKHEALWTDYQREELLLTNDRTLNVVICPACKGVFKEW